MSDMPIQYPPAYDMEYLSRIALGPSPMQVNNAAYNQALESLQNLSASEINKYVVSEVITPLIPKGINRNGDEIPLNSYSGANKKLYYSRDLLNKQRSIATYSLEIEMLYDTLRNVITGLYKPCTNEDLEFTANYDRPSMNNKHVICVSITQPIELLLYIEQYISDNRLRWKIDAATTPNTPMDVIKAINNYKFDNQRTERNNTYTPATKEIVSKKRKITI